MEKHKSIKKFWVPPMIEFISIMNCDIITESDNQSDKISENNEGELDLF